MKNTYSAALELLLSLYCTAAPAEPVEPEELFAPAAVDFSLAASSE